MFDLACFGVADSAILYRQRSIPARIALLDCHTLFSVLGHKKSLLHSSINVETPRKFTAKALEDLLELLQPLHVMNRLLSQGKNGPNFRIIDLSQRVNFWLKIRRADSTL